MSPLGDTNNLLISFIISIFSVIASGTVIILCCWLKRSRHNRKDEGKINESIFQDGERSLFGGSGHTVTACLDIEKRTCVNDDVTTASNEAALSASFHKSYGSISSSYQLKKEELDNKLDLDGATSGSYGSDLGVQSDFKVLIDKDKGETKEEELATDAMEDPSLGEITTKGREQEKEAADLYSQQAFPDHNFKAVPDLGSRLQKYWYHGVDSGGKIMLKITAKVSKICPLRLDHKELKVLQEVMRCLKHPFLLPVYDVASNGEFVSVLIEYVETGSLRDRIYSASSPLEDWAIKYSKVRMPIPVNEIATCGSQILEAVLLLYNQGCKSIGQIQSGNVFKVEDRYVLGGYENTFLGYRTSIFAKIQRAGLIDYVDVMMFGLMIYEMATGISDPSHVPLIKSDYEKINDSRVKGILNYIFSDKLRSVEIQEAIKKILCHRFFAAEEKTPKEKLLSFELSPDGHHLLNCVNGKQCGQAREVFICESLDTFSVSKKLTDTYTELTSWEQIGWRKIVAKAKKSKDSQWSLLSAFKIPYTCPIYVEPALNYILELLRHQNLLETRDIHCFKVDQAYVFILCQRFMEEGSLKDKLHKVSPFTSYREKYENTGGPFSDEDIARIGSQILQIAVSLCYIDGQHPPLKLGFLHSGNIFMEGSKCYLGGLENLLLGCRPQDYLKYRDHLSCLDTIMFGHLIFELATGRELCSAIPRIEDYSLLSDSIKDLLTAIFNNLKMTLKEVSHLPFFKVHQSNLKLAPKPIINHAGKLLFSMVRKAKKKDQDNGAGKRKFQMKVAIRRNH